MHVTIITDASWCPTTHVAGYGYWIASERGKSRGSGTMKSLVESSQAAEMMAVVNGLCQAMRRGLVLNGDIVLLQTDCQNAIDFLSGTYRPTSKADQDVVDHMHKICAKAGVTIRYRHVKGHTRGKTPSTYVNNYCDGQAKGAMRKRRTVAYREQCEEAIKKLTGEDNAKGT